MNWLNTQICDAYELMMKMGEEFPALQAMIFIDSLTTMAA